jgi:transitional endoplasmic reticulum ATPase
VEQIQRGVLRPGRIDAIVHIGELDAEGYEKLVNNLIPKQHLGEIDYGQLVEAFHGYVPAFVTEAITGAMRYMIARTEGVLDVIATEDIVHAADALRPQFEKMQTAKEGADTTTLDAGLRKMLIDVVNHTKLDQNQDGIAVLEHDEDLATS